ncbi:MAG: hypothetical protein EOM02_10680 [Synergistales bacterium]|nr:hypothetical protein [Synergistales bacterium]
MLWNTYLKVWQDMQSKAVKLSKDRDVAAFMLVGENPVEFLEFIQEYGRFLDSVGETKKVELLRKHWAALNKVVRWADRQN